MLVPAATRRSEIMQQIQKYYYTMDMFYETGSMFNWMPDIQVNPDENHFQYAVVLKDETLVGYIDFTIDWYTQCAKNFGIISFDRKNMVIGKDLSDIIKHLIDDYKLHRIEWRMVGGNPVEKHYDRLCVKYGGTKHVLTDACRDMTGKYHDDVIYEIVLPFYS